MTQLKILMTAAAVLVSLASAPAFAQTARTLHTNKGVTTTTAAGMATTAVAITTPGSTAGLIAPIPCRSEKTLLPMQPASLADDPRIASHEGSGICRSLRRKVVCVNRFRDLEAFLSV